MLRPVLDIKSTAHEIARLCRLLNELKNICDDSNLSWKIAQLLSLAGDLNEQFLDEFKLWDTSNFNDEFYQRLSGNDKVDTLLSFIFDSAVVLDAAIYKEFIPSQEFMNSVNLIRQNTLQLLHENRGLR